MPSKTMAMLMTMVLAKVKVRAMPSRTMAMEKVKVRVMPARTMTMIMTMVMAASLR